MPLYDRVELLCTAITDQAAAESEKIRARAKEEADQRVAEAEAYRQRILAQTKAEVEDQTLLDARSRIDRAELESKRRISQTKEDALNEIFAQAQDRLQAFRETPNYLNWVQRTLASAVQQLGGNQFQVMINPSEEKWFTPDFLKGINTERSCQITLATDPELSAGGFVAVRADGRVRLDQTFQGIIERGREAFRAQIARKLWGS